MAKIEERDESQQQIEVVPAHVVELVERAQIDMQIATARKYPRSLAHVKSKMLSFATLDEETAQSCFYTLPRDGKQIQGPSVRLAEIAVSCYGNLRAASRIIDNDGKVITAQGICHDLENNTLISVEVKRRITNRAGKTYSEDMQVTAGNAASAIAFRNAVFKVVPGALVKPVYDAAKEVAVGNASTLVEKRDKILKRLNAMGATTDRVLARLEVGRVEDVDLDHLAMLIGIGTAIKDGDIALDEAFPAVSVMRATIPVEKLTPSDQPNRGHDASMQTEKPKEETPEDPTANMSEEELKQYNLKLDQEIIEREAARDQKKAAPRSTKKEEKGW